MPHKPSLSIFYFKFGGICSLFIAQGIGNQASLSEIKVEQTPQFKLLESFPKCFLRVSSTQLLCIRTAQPLSKMIKDDSIKYPITPCLRLLLGHNCTVSPSYFSLIFTFIGKIKSNETASHTRSVMEDASSTFIKKKKKQLIQSYVSPNKTHLFLFVKSSILYTVSEPQQQKKAPHQKKKRAEYFKLADFWGYFHTII